MPVQPAKLLRSTRRTRVHHRIDQGRLAGVERTLQSAADLLWSRPVLAVAAKGLYHLLLANGRDEVVRIARMVAPGAHSLITGVDQQYHFSRPHPPSRQPCVLEGADSGTGDLFIFLTAGTADPDGTEQLVAALDGHGTLLRNDLAFFHEH